LIIFCNVLAFNKHTPKKRKCKGYLESIGNADKILKQSYKVFEIKWEKR
jgi:hypothetical protein